MINMTSFGKIESSLDNLAHFGTTYGFGAICTLFLALSFLYFLSTAIYNLYFHPLREYPGPKLAAACALPQIWYLTTGEPVSWIHSLHQKYGSTVRVGPNELSFIDAQAWKDIYGLRVSGRDKSENPKNRKFYEFAEFDNTPSLVSLPGQEPHSRVRRIFSHAFSDKALKEQEPMLMKYINLLVRRLGEITADPSSKVDMVKMYNFTTFDIMGDLAFGESLKMLEHSSYTPWVTSIFDNLKAATVLQAIGHMQALSSLLNLLLGRYIHSMKKLHNKFSVDRVNNRLAKKTDRPDIWTLVLRQESEKALSLKEMHSNAGMFMIAGTETTATLLSGLTYYLLSNPDMMQRLTQEIRSAFKSESEINIVSVAQLEYLRACIDEGLRMYPPTPSGLPRKTPPEGAMICDKWVAGNTVIYITQYAAFHSASHFRNPDSFIPDRWLSDSASLAYASDNKSVMQPFSVGPRNCIGKNLAQHEMRLILAKVIYNFDLTLQPESSKDWDHQKIFLLWDKKPLMVSMTPVQR